MQSNFYPQSRLGFSLLFFTQEIPFENVLLEFLTERRSSAVKWTSTGESLTVFSCIWSVDIMHFLLLSIFRRYQKRFVPALRGRVLVVYPVECS